MSQSAPATPPKVAADVSKLLKELNKLSEKCREQPTTATDSAVASIVHKGR